MTTTQGEQPDYLTVEEAANLLRVSPWQMRNLCRAGLVDATRPGRKWLIAPSAVDAYLASGKRAAA